MWCCRQPSGAKKQAVIPMLTEPFISHIKQLSRREKQNLTLIFLLIIAAEWVLKIKMASDLIKWNTPEEAFEAWKECTKGRPCDYTGMSYAKLTGGSGIQWPCNEKFPEWYPSYLYQMEFLTPLLIIVKRMDMI